MQEIYHLPHFLKVFSQIVTIVACVSVHKFREDELTYVKNVAPQGLIFDCGGANRSPNNRFFVQKNGTEF